jgi:hypothetical protein
MKHLLLILALASCGDNTKPCLDAAVDAVPDATIKDWRWAFGLYAEGWCELQARCDPAWLARYYGTVERCTEDNTTLCDGYLGIDECAMAYPPDRYTLIMQCETDEAALDCAAYPDVPTCDQALAQ